MPPEQIPYWILISVLFSSLPLTPALATRLHQAALDLYRKDETVAPIVGDLAQGEVRSLGKDLILGTVGGPAFEADLETERGHGVVRFLLTRQGLELTGERPPEAALN